MSYAAHIPKEMMKSAGKSVALIGVGGPGHERRSMISTEQVRQTPSFIRTGNVTDFGPGRSKQMNE